MSLNAFNYLILNLKMRVIFWRIFSVRRIQLQQHANVKEQVAHRYYQTCWWLHRFTQNSITVANYNLKGEIIFEEFPFFWLNNTIFIHTKMSEDRIIHPNVVRQYDNPIFVSSGGKLYRDRKTADVYFVVRSGDVACKRIPAHKIL